MSEFHFAVARITAAQICRAVGLERCVPSVLDELTDILVRYLMMLGSAARDASESRNGSDISAEDAMLAAVECSSVRGGLLSTELSRKEDSKPEAGVEDIEELLGWVKGRLNSRLIAVARPQRQAFSSIGAAQGAALAALPSSAAAASQFNANSLAPGAVPNPADALQPPMAAQPTTGSHATLRPPQAGELHATEAQQDWLTLALNRQAVMGHHDWFVNTELGKHTDPDPKIYGN